MRLFSKSKDAKSEELVKKGIESYNKKSSLPESGEKYIRALDFFEKAIEIRPNFQEAWYQKLKVIKHLLSISYDNPKLNQKCRENFIFSCNAILKFDPKNQIALWAIFDYFREEDNEFWRKNIETELSIINKILEFNPHDCSALIEKGQIFIHMGKSGYSIDTFSRPFKIKFSENWDKEKVLEYYEGALELFKEANNILNKVGYTSSGLHRERLDGWRSYEDDTPSYLIEVTERRINKIEQV